MRIFSIHHVPFEGLGAIGPEIRRLGHAATPVRLYAGEPLPDPARPQALIVMGGPMGVDDEADFPWLAPEKRFLDAILERGIPVLGVCLGAQLLAQALGATVRKNPHTEIGWFPIWRDPQATRSPIGACLPEEMTVFHWHGDTFDIPGGARRLCSSQACPNQGFVLDERVVGLQFHLETTPQVAQELVELCADRLVPAPFVQTAEQILFPEAPYAENEAVLGRILAQWLHVASPPRKRADPCEAGTSRRPGSRDGPRAGGHPRPPPHGALGRPCADSSNSRSRCFRRCSMRSVCSRIQCTSPASPSPLSRA